MTDQRDKKSGGSDSVARTTAREVPYARELGSESDPAPPAQRGQQLPRDAAQEVDPATVELAVLRDPLPVDDPSTKQGGKRAAARLLGTPPESVTPESPGTRAARPSSQALSPEPPSLDARALASGTLLSVGSVDPRGKTERSLETPRMFFSDARSGAGAYFEPASIPAVTVHQTLENETVKLSDSVDPRRAKTIPRLDREALPRRAEYEAVPVSVEPVAMSQPVSSLPAGVSSDVSQCSAHADSAEPSFQGVGDGQIHASLSHFRGEPDPDFSLRGAPTRPEPLAARGRFEEPASDPSSAVPTQRDLPAHRLSSEPPPPISKASDEHFESVVPGSEGPRPTTASIAADEGKRRSAVPHYVAFLVALCFALVLGFWLTRAQEKQREQAEPTLENSVDVIAERSAPHVDASPELPAQPPIAQPPIAQPGHPTQQHVEKPVTVVPVQRSPKAPAAASRAPAEAPRKSTTPKPSRETIF